MLEGINLKELENEFSIGYAIKMKAYQNMSSLDDSITMIILYKSYGLYKRNISFEANIMNIKKG